MHQQVRLPRPAVRRPSPVRGQRSRHMVRLLPPRQMDQDPKRAGLRVQRHETTDPEPEREVQPRRDG